MKTKITMIAAFAVLSAGAIAAPAVAGVAQTTEVVAADVKLMRLDSARAMEASVATRRDLERDLQELRAGHAADVADREEAARALVLREDRYRASIAAMTSEHESVLATKAEMLGVARADADHARTAVGAEAALHDAALAELRASHAAATASMRSEHLAVEESRQRDAHAELETLRAEHGVANFEVSRVSEIAAAAVEGAATVAAELSAAHSELRASSTAHAQLQSALASAKEFGLSEHAAVRDAMEAVGVLYFVMCVSFLYCIVLMLICPFSQLTYRRRPHGKPLLKPVCYTLNNCASAPLQKRRVRSRHARGTDASATTTRRICAPH